ncbi:Fc.00g021680.m01.CDS01 [Cosmosporella sp. VM-42]
MPKDSSSETSKAYGTATEFLDLVENLVIKQLRQGCSDDYIVFIERCMYALSTLLDNNEHLFLGVHGFVYALLQYHFEKGEIEEEPPQVPDSLSNGEVGPGDGDCINWFFIQSTISPDISTNFCTSSTESTPYMVWWRRPTSSCRAIYETPGKEGIRPEFFSALDTNKRPGGTLDGGESTKKQRRHGEKADTLDSEIATVDPKDAMILALENKVKTLENREKQLLSSSTSWEKNPRLLRGKMGT